MLHQLEFKLHVERQYKEGIDKMVKLYMADGDRKARCVSTSALLSALQETDALAPSSADTENKRVESKQKMVLLSQALKKYKTLDVMGELGEEEDGAPIACVSALVRAGTDTVKRRHRRGRQGESSTTPLRRFADHY